MLSEKDKEAMHQRAKDFIVNHESWDDATDPPGSIQRFLDLEVDAWMADFTISELARANPDTVPDSPWTAIESVEDLPNIVHSTDEFWWTNRINGQVSRNGFNPGSEDQWVDAYSAWMPVTKPSPYAPTDSEIEVSE